MRAFNPLPLRPLGLLDSNWGAQAWIVALGFMAGTLACGSTMAQIGSSSGSVASASKPAASRAATTARSAKSSATGPSWNELSAAQQKSLLPLASQWNTISEGQKRKWIALSSNYPKLSADEQAKLHSRMAEWVTLSPQQRVQARLNFADAKRLSPDDKKAKWQAYQSLSPEEKQRLGAGATSKPVGAAPAVKPVSPQKLASVPKAKTDPKDRPRITTDPHHVDHNTLLPQQQLQTAAPVPVPVQRN